VKRTEEKQYATLGDIQATALDFRFERIRDEGAGAASGNLGTNFYERPAWEMRAMARASMAVELRSARETHRNPFPRPPGEPYVPLHLLTGYAFGRSTMPVEEIATIMLRMHLPAAAIADPFSLVGAMEFDRICRSLKMKALIGASFELSEGGAIVLIARSRRGYVQLSRLITECHLNEPRGFPLATWERLELHATDLICLTGGGDGPLDRLLIQRDREAALTLVERLVRIYGKANVFVEIERSYLPWSQMVERQLLDLAEAMKLRAVAGGAVTHARREHFPAQDILVCADRLCLMDEVQGRKPRRDDSQPQIAQVPERALNGERFFRWPDEMEVLYRDRRDLLRNALRIPDLCEDHIVPPHSALPSAYGDDDSEIYRIVRSKAPEVYGRKYNGDHRERLEDELRRIVKLKASSHFLIAHEFCDWARQQGIAMSGRGSVIDSAVAYVLGLSRIDAVEHKLHFERFMPTDGNKRPDIDIDFEAKRRDDVRNHLVDRYGVEHVAAVSAIGTYRSRGIIREIGKAFGIPDETLGFLAKRLHGAVTPERLESAIDARPELRDSGIPKEHFGWVFKLAERLKDLPRNIRLHSSGVILSATPVQDIVPVMWSASDGLEENHLRMIQWDKRSAKHAFDKFDILCLRGQDVLGGFESRRRQHDTSFRSDSIKAIDDPEVYRAMRAGELIGIPQSASPAMRQAHQRLQTKSLHEASLVQAGIRPGVGGAVKINELIARHRGKPFEYEHPDLEEILERTYGLIVFQEQVDQLLSKFCGYSSGKSEDIRDAVYKRRDEGFVEDLREQIIKDATGRGYSQKIAEHVFNLVSQFKGYGFAQGHALAFAEVSLRSVWCQQNYPAPYFASLLDAQPAGYYGPITIANEARNRGVKMLPPDVNVSGLGFDVEDFRAEDDPQMFVPEGAIRTGLWQITGISDELRTRIVESRPYRSFFDFVTRAHPARDELERLIFCGALDSLHSNRRALLWAIPTALDHGAMLRGATDRLPLGFEDPPLPAEIADFRPAEKAVYERRILEMDVERHLMAYERERVSAKGGLTARAASQLEPGTKVFVVGNPIRLRFPPTQSGRRVMFFDLEDETGLLNVTCFDEVYQRDGHKVICHPYVTLWGETQDRDGHLSFLVSRIHAYEPVLQKDLADPSPLPIVTADFLMT
jgi:error-prone DNA polymerase